MSKLLGLDYGDRWIGVAVTDEAQQHAFARQAIDQRFYPEPLDVLQQCIEEEKIEKIILGLPYRNDGSEGDQAARVRVFGLRCEQMFHLPVAWVDERMSSQAADRLLIASERTGLQGSGTQDSLAAAMILQQYCDQQRV
ncbi:MAG: Holliday junction resolvase RuvX [Patescibacteria group bacterium]